MNTYYVTIDYCSYAGNPLSKTDEIKALSPNEALDKLKDKVLKQGNCMKINGGNAKVIEYDVKPSESNVVGEIEQVLPSFADEEDDDRIFSATDMYDAMHRAVSESLKGNVTLETMGVFIDTYLDNEPGS